MKSDLAIINLQVVCFLNPCWTLYLDMVNDIPSLLEKMFGETAAISISSFFSYSFVVRTCPALMDRGEIHGPHVHTSHDSQPPDEIFTVGVGNERCWQTLLNSAKV